MKAISTVAAVLMFWCGAGHAAERPNILWIVVDDMSANFSCYGEQTISTPNVDRLASRGTRFTHAYVTAPVCSTCRSALITGMYQTAIGAHHHRSGRGSEKIHLPEGVTPLPVLFQQAGYYTCIGGSQPRGERLGKTDYNFEYDARMYDGNDWSGRAADQPFFMQVQLSGGKLRDSNGWRERVERELGSSTPPESVTLPPYYPRDAVLLDDWARYLDACRYTDKEVGDVLARLEREGILDSTLVIFMTDHGISHARGKQFLYDEGTHVPLVVSGPGVAAAAVRDDLIEHIDLAAISLAAAGIEIPPWMQARDVLADDYEAPAHVFAARDRCDETVDRIRSVRSDKFLYIRNYYPERPLLQPCAYKDAKSILKRLRELHAEGGLDELQEQLLFSDRRPAEELYEWTSDRFQVRNLAEVPEYGSMLSDMRSQLDRWIEATGDQGQFDEAPAMYDSDMQVYLDAMRARPERAAVIAANIQTMKDWAAKAAAPSTSEASR